MPASKSSDKSSDAKTRKIIDVSEPGKTAPSETSRPIIVSSRPILRRDPMVTGPDGMEKEEAPEDKPVARTAKPELKITPLTPEEKMEAPAKLAEPTAASAAPTMPSAAAKPATPPAQPVITTAKSVVASATEGDIVEDDEEIAKPAGEPTAEHEFMLEKPDAPTMTPEAKPALTPDSKPALSTPPTSPTPFTPPTPPAPAPSPAPAVPDTDDDDDDEEDTDGQLAPNQALDVAKRKEEDAKATRLAEQEKIIESKQYFLPIDAVEKRRGLERFVLLLVVVILLALIWLDIALDAGILRIGGVHALTHFFKS